jgi:hypothetical protein
MTMWCSGILQPFTRTRCKYGQDPRSRLQAAILGFRLIVDSSRYHRIDSSAMHELPKLKVYTRDIISGRQARTCFGLRIVVLFPLPAENWIASPEPLLQLSRRLPWDHPHVSTWTHIMLALLRWLARVNIRFTSRILFLLLWSTNAVRGRSTSKTYLWSYHK